MGGTGKVSPEREARRTNWWPDINGETPPARFEIANFPGIFRGASGNGHYVKLQSMLTEKSFRSWTAAVRFYNENAEPCSTPKDDLLDEDLEDLLDTSFNLEESLKGLELPDVTDVPDEDLFIQDTKQVIHWSPVEDARLLSAVKMYTKPGKVVKGAWEQVAIFVHTRSMRQCRRRWDLIDPERTEQQKERLKRHSDRARVRDRAKRQAKFIASLEQAAQKTVESACKELDALDIVRIQNDTEKPETLYKFLCANETLVSDDDFVDSARIAVAPIRTFDFNSQRTGATQVSFSFSLATSKPSLMTDCFISKKRRKTDNPISKPMIAAKES